MDSRVGAKRWIVSGQVQGVSFRHYTQEMARQLELTGWVRNLPDGTVEVQVAGDELILGRFQDQLRDGPRFARVDDIVEEPLDADRLIQNLGHRGFEVRW
ncbi:MAG: acylphosphatase [Acidobacteriota bacterium]